MKRLARKPSEVVQKIKERVSNTENDEEDQEYDANMQTQSSMDSSTPFLISFQGIREEGSNSSKASREAQTLEQELQDLREQSVQ